MAMANRTPEDTAEIARICLPFLVDPDNSKNVLAARSLLTFGLAYDAVQKLSTGIEPEAAEALRRMAYLAREMVQEPAVRALLERVAKTAPETSPSDRPEDPAAPAPG